MKAARHRSRPLHRSTLDALIMGYPSVLVGTRPYYNPTVTNLPLEVVFYVTESPCGAFITFNHAITNIIVQGMTTNGTETNYTYTIRPFDALSETIPLTNEPGELPDLWIPHRLSSLRSSPTSASPSPPFGVLRQPAEH